MSVAAQRVERIGDATLYLGDCREIMPTPPHPRARECRLLLLILAACAAAWGALPAAIVGWM